MENIVSMNFDDVMEKAKERIVSLLGKDYEIAGMYAEKTNDEDERKFVFAKMSVPKEVKYRWSEEKEELELFFKIDLIDVLINEIKEEVKIGSFATEECPIGFELKTLLIITKDEIIERIKKELDFDKELTMKEYEKLTREIEEATPKNVDETENPEEVSENTEEGADDAKNKNDEINNSDWNRMREEFFTEKKTLMEIVLDLTERNEAAASALRCTSYLSDLPPSSTLMLLAGIYMGELEKLASIGEIDMFKVAEILYSSFDEDALHDLENFIYTALMAEKKFQEDN